MSEVEEKPRLVTGGTGVNGLRKDDKKLPNSRQKLSCVSY